MIKFFKKIGNALLAGLIHILCFILRAVMRIIYIPRVEYKDPSAKEAMKHGAVLIANHKSHKDGFVIPQMLSHKKIYVLVTRKWYDKKFLNVLFRHLRYIPINLNETDTQWMAYAEKILKDGNCVLIFPEGKLEKNGVHEPFQYGFLLPAKHLNIPVIPMATVGEYRIFHRQKIIVGSPINLDLRKPGRLSAVLKTASEQCEREVFALADENPAAKNSPH